MGQEASSTAQDKNDNCSCRIVVVGKKAGDDALAELSHLPSGAKIVGTGCSLDELRSVGGDDFKDANVLLITNHFDKSVLIPIMAELPFLSWIHSTTTGVEFLMFPEIVNNNDITLTNAKGMYSSTLAEYSMAAIAYFTKDIPRLMAQRDQKAWTKFPMREIRGMTMGIVGKPSIYTYSNN